MIDIHTPTSTVVIEVLIPGPQGPSGAGTDNIGGYSVAIDGIETDHILVFNGQVWQNKVLFAGGDMTKAVYDSKNDGKVNIARIAETVDWSGITSLPATFTPASHTHVTSEITGLAALLDTKASTGDLGALTIIVNDKAPLVSPALTGIPTAPTAISGANTTQIATTAFVTSAIAAVAPGGVTWDDIKDKPATYPPSTHTHDDRYYTKIETGALLDVKAPLESPAFTGIPTASTAIAGTNTTQLATTAFVTAATARNVAVITTSGNFMVPASIRSLDVQVWGGGGGGGGSGTAGQTGSGGGGGGYSRAAMSVTPGQVIAAVVGAAGSAGTGGTKGGTGGTSSFGGLSSTGGVGGDPNGTGGGGSAGTGSGGTINLSGSNGGTRMGSMSDALGGAGGSSPFGGAGGPSRYGGGSVGVTPGGGGAGQGGGAAGGGSDGAPGLIVIAY